MKRAVDTNVLVYAHVASVPEHDRARRFLEGELRRPGRTLVVTPGILHEFVHVITDGRRFDPPVTMSEAIEVARSYLGRTNVECLGVDAECTSLALDLLEEHRLGRKRVADTLLAATLLRHGVQEIITCNGGDFEVIDGLHVIDPLAGE